LNSKTDEIKAGYETDPFMCKLTAAAPGMPNVQLLNSFWFINDHLVIPKGNNVREMLFHLAHDSLGHFGASKSYAALRDGYYWPNIFCSYFSFSFPVLFHAAGRSDTTPHNKKNAPGL